MGRSSCRQWGGLVVVDQATIDRLKLNDDECCGARDEYVSAYRSHDVSWSYLSRRAPFVARELRRQDLLHAGDG